MRLIVVDPKSEYSVYDYRYYESLEAITINEAISVWCGYITIPAPLGDEKTPSEWYRIHYLLNEGLEDGTLKAFGKVFSITYSTDPPEFEIVESDNISIYTDFILLKDLWDYMRRFKEKSVFLSPEKRNGDHHLKTWHYDKDESQTAEKSESQIIPKGKPTRKNAPPRYSTDKGAQDIAHKELDRLLKKRVEKEGILKTQELIDRKGQVLDDDIREVFENISEDYELATKTKQNWIRDGLKKAGVTLLKGRQPSKKKK